MLRILATALLITLATPATAASASTEPDVQVAFRPITIAPNPGMPAYTEIFGVRPDGGSEPVKVAFTADFTEVNAFATVEQFNSDTCTTTATKVSCVLLDAGPLTGFPTSLAIFAVTPSATAAAGDEGKVQLTTRIDDGPAITSEALIRVGQPVNLTGVTHEHRTAGPGGTATFRPQLTNNSTVPVTGVVLGLPFPPDLYAGNYRNCAVGLAVVCAFETTLQPGRTYRLSGVIPVTVPAKAVVGSTMTTPGGWLTQAAFEDLAAAITGLADGKPGAGPELTLALLPGATALPQVDVNFDDDDADMSLTVTGTKRTSLTAIGAEVTGAVGDTLKLKLGFENPGPGTLIPAYFSNNAVSLTVHLPRNLEVLGADSRCDPGLDVNEWDCHRSDAAFGSGRSERYGFTVKVIKGSAKLGPTIGAVTVSTGFTRDSAKLVVTAPGGGGGELPISGPSTTAGLLFVGFGLLLRFLARRRPHPTIT